MVTIETDIFVIALSLRSGSKAVSKYIMGDAHINAERLNSYRDINYYLEMSNKEVWFLIRNPLDRFISGIYRDLLIERKTIEEIHEYRKNNWYHGQPILQYIKDEEYKILPYDDIKKYVDVENDEKFAENFKTTHYDLAREYANTIDLKAEFEAYDYIMNNKQVLSPKHFKNMVAKAKLVNYKGDNINKGQLWDM